jgi:hypothetical protein
MNCRVDSSHPGAEPADGEARFEPAGELPSGSFHKVFDFGDLSALLLTCVMPRAPALPKPQIGNPLFTKVEPARLAPTRASVILTNAG